MLTLRDALAKVKQHYEECAAKTMRNIENCYCAAAALNSEGFKVQDFNSWYGADGFTLHVEKSELPRVRAALGAPLKLHSKSIVDTRRRLLRITLMCAAFPDVYIAYTDKLPRKRPGQPAPKCRIKKVRYVTTERRLVCEA